MNTETNETTANNAAENPVNALVMRWSIDDFLGGNVVIDFTHPTDTEILALQRLWVKINGHTNTPARNFGNTYYCADGYHYDKHGARRCYESENDATDRWCKPICRVTEIDA